MFTDTDYIRATKELITSEKTRICTALSQIPGLKLFPPTANFILVKIEKEGIDADILFDTAIKQNMMIRNCASFAYLNEKFFRFCFMHPTDNDRLLSCIREVMSAS